MLKLSYTFERRISDKKYKNEFLVAVYNVMKFENAFKERS